MPVLDLRQRLGMPPSASGDESRIVIVKPGGSMVGLTVDSSPRSCGWRKGP
ncbi:MAG: chemotaxis protein CheW [Bacillota bacterium]